MEIVVLNSDIARLVLSYLKKQRLEKASRTFCKTSPYLKQEFSAYKQGLQLHSFFPELEEIICEYVQITRKVEQLLSKQPDELRSQLKNSKLSDKLNALFEANAQRCATLGASAEQTAKSPDTGTANSSSSTNVQSDKENTAKKRTVQKRKRYSSDEHKASCSYGKAKRPRLLQPFCFVSTKRPSLRGKPNPLAHYSTCDEQSHSDDTWNAELEDADEESDLSLEGPTKQSTPHVKTSVKFTPPTLPEISQAILDNPEFQMKLVENINQALNTSNTTLPADAVPGASTVKQASTEQPSGSKALNEEQQIITSNQLLDQMVKNILEATEKDPAFDAIIEEVVGASNKSQVSASVQCNIDAAPSSNVLPTAPLVPQTHTGDIISLPPNCVSAPRTPLIIRTAIAAANATHNDLQASSALVPNNSFGSMIDPNFSISKLIVLNSNESAQKQPPSDQTIGNTTADQLINQLTSGADNAPHVDDQVYFDASTGQLTFPLFLTNDGLLANFPFLINNELVTQQLQPDNIANLDASRIEIPLAEPIIVSADQLPPNSIIVSSAQKALTEEEQKLPQAQRTISKKTQEALRCTSIPTSLDSRMSVLERATPSASGIVNAKAVRSLSTPRRRQSHVRTLTFSPQSTSTSSAFATTLATRREMQIRTKRMSKPAPAEEKPTVSEKPIIKNVEILPRFSTVDTSANESSNSCSVPPLFAAGEESSNQTVIGAKMGALQAKAKAVEQCKAPTGAAALKDTPKRKQVRRAAVRACKRQLSKSSNEEDMEMVPVAEDAASAQNQDQENCATTVRSASTEETNSPQDAMLEEWKRMRSATKNDLDARLRELNSQMGGGYSEKRVTRKRVRRKKAAAAKKKTPSKPASVRKRGIETETTKTSAKKEKRRASKEKSKEFNIKIPTPQKAALDKSKERRDDKAPKSGTKVKAETAVPLQVQSTVDEVDQVNDAPFAQHARDEHEREKRTANIGYLLDTPFKEPNIAGYVPPTPGIFAPSLDTPLSKLRPADEVAQSTSVLFGSLTKSELDTPLLSAITPGCLRFTPFGATPRSAATTEPSSGGSYYKPDESEDLDRNIDKLLRDSAQKKRNVDEEQQQQEVRCERVKELQKPQFDVADKAPESSAICVEIPVEKLRVEPLVLKRIKSFSSELDGTDIATNKIDPHYTLASGLPEICAEADDSRSSNSSSGSVTYSSSSNTSSSSSSSSSCSSPASQPNPTANVEPSDVAEATHKTPQKTLSLENLSDISSTEDEDWQKLAVTEEENSQLVNDDGEVRYPVRSWLTPSKEKAVTQSPSSTIKVTLPRKTAEKSQRLINELELKRERMREKLKSDDREAKEKQKVTAPAPAKISATLAATRKLKTLRDIKPKQPEKKTVCVQQEEERPLDVLTALNLSAKKQTPANEVTRTLHAIDTIRDVQRQSKMSAPCAVDDNAVSNIFGTASTAHYSKNVVDPSLKAAAASTKATQRKVLQIEALPVGKNARGGAKQKKIVCKPLGFKGAITAPTSEEKLSSHLADAATNATPVVSPIPKIKITTAVKTPGSVEAATSQQRVSPRLTKGKKPISNTKPAKVEKATANKAAAKPATKLTKKQQAKTLTKNQETPPEAANVALDEAEEQAKTRRRPIKPKPCLKTTTKVTKKKKDQASSATAPTKVSSPEPTEPEPKQKEVIESNSVTVEISSSNKDAPPATSSSSKGDATAETAVIAVSPPKITLPNPSTPATTHEIDDTSDDDDPLEGCELTSIAETDAVHFITLKYDGPDEPPKELPVKHDFSNFKMVVAIDEHERHTWRMSDEICLFTAAPIAVPVETQQAIRNIPKKRKIRITTANYGEDVESVVSTPAASSTPVAPTSSTTAVQSDAVQSFKTDTQSEPAEARDVAASSSNTKCSDRQAKSPDKVSSSGANVAEKIKIEDIDLILTQLYGT